MGILLFDFCNRRNARLLFTTVETSFWQLSFGGPLLENYWRKRFSRVNSLLLLHLIVGHFYVILHLFFPYISLPEGRTRWLPLLVAFPLNTDKSPVYEIPFRFSLRVCDSAFVRAVHAFGGAAEEVGIWPDGRLRRR
jgi:hypothetical protein